MIPWTQRSVEVQSLLNPGLCSVLLWKAALAYQNSEKSGKLPFELAFLILPMTLHRGTREALPRTVKTSLAVWVDQEPILRATIADRARALVPITRDALLFGSIHGILAHSSGLLHADPAWNTRVTQGTSDCSAEVKECLKRAEFLGRWFVSTGSPETVMATIGVCP